MSSVIQRRFTFGHVDMVIQNLERGGEEEREGIVTPGQILFYGLALLD